MRMKYIVLVVAISMGPGLIACNSQIKPTPSGVSTDSIQQVGGAFENADYMYRQMEESPNATDTSAGWWQTGQKLMITGTVYQSDTQTPAANVLLYYYHTNTEGRYEHKPAYTRSMAPNKLGQTHGYIRGWVRTDSSGRYTIYTVQPGVYPTRDEPAHIHMSIKEAANLKEYYIDDFVFDDDSLLNAAKRQKMENRGGSGVLRLIKRDALAIGERDIYLGLNIPDYPHPVIQSDASGPAIGEEVSSFLPFHAWGPDAGTRTCPVCKYGWYNGVLLFVGNQPNWPDIKKWLLFLETKSVADGKYLKVYLVYGNRQHYNAIERERELAAIGRNLGLRQIALTYVPSLSDAASEVNLLGIGENITNTIIVYKRRKVVGKLINADASEANQALLEDMLSRSRNDFFSLQ